MLVAHTWEDSFGYPSRAYPYAQGTQYQKGNFAGWSGVRYSEIAVNSCWL
jgi:hypothetical protein